ncbi:alpha/beta hydrolase [Xylariales sp. PMI_506]|nr:alpha/beta hydrolase [Xylariales sp. PMI_506]
MPFLEVNGKRLFYHKTSAEKVSKPGSNLSVLAIHGLGSTHSFYLPVFRQLAEAGFTCYGYDTYGSGHSVLSDNAEQSVGSMSDDVLGLMSKLGLTAKQTILIGHSMGGMVACQAATQHPFAGLVLLGPVHPSPAAAEVFSKRIQIVHEQGMEAMADTIPRAATGSRSTATQHAWIRSLLLSQHPAGYISLCNVIAKANPPEYQRITSPVLVVAGAEDKSAPLAGCRAILESCKPDVRTRIEVLDGMGHWHCVEAPDAVGKLIVEFAHEVREPGAV